jgi:hypothetical protein
MDIRKKCVILGRWAVGSTAVCLQQMYFNYRKDPPESEYMIVIGAILLLIPLAIFLLEREPKPKQEDAPE